MAFALKTQEEVCCAESAHMSCNSGRYNIQSIIGQGGAGTVYLATDQLLKRNVAIKRLNLLEGCSVDPSVYKTDSHLGIEIEALCRIQHPNVVSVHDVSCDDDGLFIVMEHIDGTTFDDLASGGFMLFKQFRELAIQSLDAILASHEQGVLHLDLKPSNMMIVWLPSDRIHVKIVDFGLAKMVREADTAKYPDSRSSSLHGSIYFMSPEMLQGHDVDERSDLYSLGCLFYYALSGKFPFQGESSVQVMASHMQGNVEPLKKWRLDLSDDLCTWVMSMIDKQAENRPKDARAALTTFREF